MDVTKQEDMSAFYRNLLDQTTDNVVKTEPSQSEETAVLDERYVWLAVYHLGRVQQLIGRIGRTTWDGLMLDRSAVGQLSSLSSRTKWQLLLASPAGIRCHFVLLDNDESCPTADCLTQAIPVVWPIRPMSC